MFQYVCICKYQTAHKKNEKKKMGEEGGERMRKQRHQKRGRIEKGAVVQHAVTAEFCCRIQGWQAGGCAEAILGGAVED